MLVNIEAAERARGTLLFRNAGVLFFARSVRRFFPEAYITCLLASPCLTHFLASSLLSTAVFLDCHHTPLASSLGGALRLSLSAFNTWPACWEPRVTMRF